MYVLKTGKHWPIQEVKATLMKKFWKGKQHYFLLPNAGLGTKRHTPFYIFLDQFIYSFKG